MKSFVNSIHRINPLLAVLPALILSLDIHAQTNLPTNFSQQNSIELTRADVLADLAAWRKAGMDRYEPLYSSYGLENTAYLASYQEYIRLKNDKAFNAEIKKNQSHE